MAASALDECVSKVDNLILEVGKGMEGKDVPRMNVDPDDPWSDIWTPPPSVYKVSDSSHTFPKIVFPLFL
jgi:hypothetical protein